MPTYIAPRVHLNGDTREELISQLTDAALALGDALTALRKAMPNARNYYVISESAFNRARTEHIAGVSFRAV